MHKYGEMWFIDTVTVAAVYATQKRKGTRWRILFEYATQQQFMQLQNTVNSPSYAVPPGMSCALCVARCDLVAMESNTKCTAHDSHVKVNN